MRGASWFVGLASIAVLLELCGCPAGVATTLNSTLGASASDDETSGGASDGGAGATEPAADAILVSIVMHFEEPPGYPDFETDVAAFAEYRAALLRFANVLAARQVAFDFQSDWNFLKAVAQHDTGTDTGGVNIVRYLHDTPNFSIDPHAHETRYNYADVAYLIQQLGVTPTGVVGGFIATPPPSSVLEAFWTSMDGVQYPGHAWTPEMLWGAASGNHVNDESLWISGVWRPRDRGHFLEHSESAPLPCIGGFGGTWEALDLLLSLRAANRLADGVHTCTIMTNGREIIQPGFIEAFDAAVAARRGDAGIRWVTLPQVHQIWRDEFGGVASTLAYADAAALAVLASPATRAP